MPIPWKADQYYATRRIEQYDDSIEQLCRKQEVLYVPLWDKIRTELLTDGLHPNSEGHRKIFEMVRDFLEEHRFIT